ncbi:helix-turn-helix transcriptional regulator [Catellatospora vulcania]|uniref:helix-turn-helix transcriptional regulator n=1 Tax=Catellatospora vulcania TaxID=1460450 RepID=UPI001E30E879|nr:AraC family transcriptional regulator [Catellatospora vulcania]
MSSSPADPLNSPILTVYHGEMASFVQLEAHAHAEPILMSSATATLAVLSQERDWLVPPGYGLWVPGGVEHAASAVRGGEVSVIMFDPDRCPITWTEPTGVPVGRLLHELVVHLHQVGPEHPSRPHAEALVFALLTPLPAHHIQISMPTDPRVAAVAERLIADPADPRELAAWADHVHTSVRTLSRLFLSETGLSFARWRTQVRVRAAIQLLADGTTVDSVARAVGYRKTSAFIAAFRRATGHTPGTYSPGGTPPGV